MADVLGMSPYEDDVERCTKLYPDFPIGMNMDKLKIEDCVIKFHAVNGMVSNVQKLGVEQRYEKYKSKAFKYIHNLQVYPDEPIDELVDMGIFESKEAAYFYLFDVPLIDDMTQKPLSKLRRDIVGK